MIFRIGLLFLLTGAAHLFAIFGLKYIAGQGDLAGVAGIGKAEALLQFLISIIGFGMQTEGLRTLAFASDWKAKLDEIQTARLTLSWLLVLGAVGAVYDSSFWCFLAAPVLGSSCDYALYARGKPVLASTLALFRVVFPLGAAMAVAGRVPTLAPETFLVAFVGVYVITNLIISKTLGASTWWPARRASLSLYIKTIPVGVINLGYYFFGLGILFFAEFLFAEAELAVVYMALKFYVVYRGALRVIQQAYVNQMNHPLVGLRADQISMVIGLVLLGSASLFPQSFITLFFGQQFTGHRALFVGLGAAALVAGVFNSFSTTAILQKRDLPMMRLIVASVLVSILVLIIGYWVSPAPESVMIALGVGEVVMAVGLMKLMDDSSGIRERLLYLLGISAGLLVPASARYLFSDSLIPYLSSFALMGGLILVVNYSKFIHPVKTDESR
ncbi:MAG: hypothetical protein JNN04_02510 [Cyclobacteriaceae bacterium]|nr:hypothetical protein [Cyclobacteriaceae bacterium]